MKEITVIGAGTMGNGIAHVFAQYGYQVTLVDVNEAAVRKGRETIEKNLERQVRKGIITGEQKNMALDRIATASRLDHVIASSDVVIEAVSEKTDMKLKVFADIDRLVKPEGILATNTSSIPITKIAAATARPDKVIGMHFMNPVPLMKLVEVIKGRETSPATTKEIMELARAIGKVPVEVNDAPGFIANRILMPMINEAIGALHGHVAGVKEIDEVMKLGMGHPMGPLQLADFIGLDVCLSILQVLHDGFADPKYAPSPVLIELVKNGQLGVKTGVGFYDYSKGTKDPTVAARFSLHT